MQVVQIVQQALSFLKSGRSIKLNLEDYIILWKSCFPMVDTAFFITAEKIIP